MSSVPDSVGLAVDAKPVSSPIFWLSVPFRLISTLATCVLAFLLESLLPSDSAVEASSELRFFDLVLATGVTVAEMC